MLIGSPLGFWAAAGYSIADSIRLNGTSDYLSMTQAAGNTSTWTISALIKRSKLTSSSQVLFHCSVAGADNFVVRYATNGAAGDTIEIYSQFDNEFQWLSVPVFRDVSAWGHFVLAMDVTQGTAANRIKVYWNGSQLTGAAGSIFSGPYPGSTTAMKVNASGSVVRIGKNNGSNYFDGYLSDFYLIDGQALTPSSFGKTDSNGVWVPIKYAGTYGTNGCKLEFKNSGALGTDTSGNGNTWTVNGSPVQTTDTPTANYATLNAIRPSTSALTVGNTTAAGTASGTIPASQSDKWYWEVKANAVGVTAGLENTSGTTYTQSVSNGTTTGFRYTHSTTTLEYTTNGSSWSTVSSAVSGVAFPYVTGASSTINFGATAFAYTPSTGFKALCTANLPSVAVTASGTFTGNANADGPFDWVNGNLTALTINGNAVTWGTHADKTAGGFKLRSSSASYNTSGSNTWTATSDKRFVENNSVHTPNTAQGNP